MLVLRVRVAGGLELSRMLADYVALWTANAPPSDGVKRCIQAAVPSESPMLQDQEGISAKMSPESYLTLQLLEVHPEVARLTTCLVMNDLVPPVAYAQFGGALLFATASPRIFSSRVASTSQPGALFAALLSHGAARNYSLGSRGRTREAGVPDTDAFSLLHKILSVDKRTPDDIANQLLQPILPLNYVTYLTALGDEIGARLATPSAAEARAAIASLVRRRLVFSSGNTSIKGRQLLGRSISFAPIRKLCELSSMGLAMSLAEAPLIVGQPTLASLVLQRDRFGRTPLHVAALHDNARALSYLLAALISELQPHEVSDTLGARDAMGYTAADLALSLGHNDSLLALKVAAAKIPTALSAPFPVHVAGGIAFRGLAAGPSPRQDDDGGWGEPAFVPEAARLAIAEAVNGNGGFGSTGGCDFDVVDAEDMSPAQFVRDYFVPMRPVLIRGLAVERAQAWRRKALIYAHGNFIVRPAFIPYAGSFGDDEAISMPLREFANRLLTCVPQSKADGAFRSCMPFGNVRDTEGELEVHVGGDPPVQGRREADMQRFSPYVFCRLHAKDTHARGLMANLTFLPSFLADAQLSMSPSSPSSVTPLVINTSQALSFEFFLGGPGSGAPMHFHGDALNSLMFGRKLWYLQPPSLSEYSTVHIVDFVMHVLPRLRKKGRTPLSCTQMAGDMLYVPRGWGHAVLNLATSGACGVDVATA